LFDYLIVYLIVLVNFVVDYLLLLMKLFYNFQLILKGGEKMEILKNFKEKAALDLQRIVFAEGKDERIIKAAEIIEKLFEQRVNQEVEKLKDFVTIIEC
jgi:endonuclease III